MASREKGTEVRDATTDGADVPEILPIMPLQEAVVFPFTMVPLVVKREAHIKMADESLEGDKIIGLFPEEFHFLVPGY